jgi:hypothetical protein
LRVTVVRPGRGPGEAGLFPKKVDNFKNLFDSQSGLMRAKDSMGNGVLLSTSSFCLMPVPAVAINTEGNAWQYTWHVQHDIPALVSMMGGMISSKPNWILFLPWKSRPDRGWLSCDVTGMIGQYAHEMNPVTTLLTCITTPAMPTNAENYPRCL